MQNDKTTSKAFSLAREWGAWGMWGRDGEAYHYPSSLKSSNYRKTKQKNAPQSSYSGLLPIPSFTDISEVLRFKMQAGISKQLDVGLSHWQRVWRWGRPQEGKKNNLVGRTCNSTAQERSCYVHLPYVICVFSLPQDHTLMCTSDWINTCCKALEQTFNTSQ